MGIGIVVEKPGTLPRYELKAKRFFDHRPAAHRWQLAEEERRVTREETVARIEICKRGCRSSGRRATIRPSSAPCS